MIVLVFPLAVKIRERVALSLILAGTKCICWVIVMTQSINIVYKNKEYEKGHLKDGNKFSR